MSPLMIILLMLILVIGTSHQTAVHKYTLGEEQSRRFPGINNRISSVLERVNYFTISVDRNERDPSTTRRTRMRQDLQHLLSRMVNKIIQQRRLKEDKTTDVRMSKSIFGKTVESNKIPIGEFSEDNGFERGVEARRDKANYKTIIDQRVGSGSAIREKLSKDLFQVSEALLPTIRRIAHSKLQQVRDYRKEPMKLGINQGNSREREQSSRMKREITMNEENGTAVWIKKDFTDHRVNMKMHAFVVKDEDIPPCCSPAKQVTNQRYFMCSGAVLTLKHTITSASCMHYADIYERNVEAELAVLVGATEPRAYVIKVNRYTMHPDYDYNVDSKDHSTNNLAILYLACSIISQDIVVPSLPRGQNNDVAHMCCRTGCDLITIVEAFDNRHIARIVQAKHLPAPMHDDEDAPSYRRSNSALEALQVINKPIFSNESFAQARRIRSPFKLAAAPTFFGKESRRSSRLQGSVKSVQSSNTKKRKKAKSARKSSAKNQPRDGKRKKPLNSDHLRKGEKPGRAYMQIMRALEMQGIDVREQLAAVDWEKVEETLEKTIPVENREKMDIFAKNIVDETMMRLEKVLGGNELAVDSVIKGNDSNVFDRLMGNKDPNKTIENFVHVFTRVVSSLLPPNDDGSIAISLDPSIEEKDLKDPPPSNQECPPLGSPIFAGETLIGLVAYTCDDVQPWVQWKYVNIVKNINWIQQKITDDIGFMETCDGPEKPTQQSLRRAVEDLKAIFTKKNLMPKESETEFRDKTVESKRRETTDDMPRSSSTGNLDDARIPATGTYLRIPKDPWFARNLSLALQAQRPDEHQRIFADFRNQPQSLAQDTPVYNVNSCYVKSDGSTDCQTRGDFDIS